VGLSASLFSKGLFHCFAVSPLFWEQLFHGETVSLCFPQKYFCFLKFLLIENWIHKITRKKKLFESYIVFDTKFLELFFEFLDKTELLHKQNGMCFKSISFGIVEIIAQMSKNAFDVCG